MLESLIGTLFGGIFRLVPELFKLYERKDERKHELAMFDMQLKADELKVKQAEIQQQTQIELADITALIEGTKAQAQQTGVKWVDGLNGLIRPLLALQWLIVLYPGVVVASFLMAVQAGISPLEAIQQCFGTEEKAMAASIASFWLVDRSLRKMNG